MIPRFLYSNNLNKAIRTGLFLLPLLSACQSVSTPELARTFSGDRALQYVNDQMAFGPRFPGSTGHIQIQDWLVEELEEMGWAVEQQSFEYKGSFLTNIIAYHPASDRENPILLGAHYDTRKFADRDLNNPTLAVPGANDGASGVAVLLELARVFIDSKQINLVFAFFDAEDQGRIDGWDWDVGSRYFVDQLDQDLQAVIIVDMIGDRDLRLPVERNSDPALVSSIWATGQELGFEAFVNEPGPSIVDDHIPFIQAEIPAVLIIDFTYPYWHTLEDNIDKVSAESLNAIGTTLETWMLSYESGEGSTSQ